MTEKIKLKNAHGVLNILAQAKKDERHDDYSIYLSGDLCQMSAQNIFLSKHMVNVKFNNVYPCVRECDKERTFQLIWRHKCDGWWHYEKQYIELGICTKEEFKETLDKWCDNKL